MKTLLFVVFASFAFVILTTETLAQCVRCKPAGQCFVCAASSSGGCTCSQLGCSDCLTSQPCAGPGICAPGDRVRKTTNIDEETIMEIARVHPRFAVALSLVRRIGGIKSSALFSSFPSDLEASDVNHWLKRSQPKVPVETELFFQEQQRRPVRSDQLNIEFSVEEPYSQMLIIRGKIINAYKGDPPETQLEIEVMEGKVVKWKVY